MITLENGKDLRGDTILSAIVRSDCAPIPETLELRTRAGDLRPFLKAGKKLEAYGRKFMIIKSQTIESNADQESNDTSALEVIALNEHTYKLAYTSSREVILSGTNFTTVYKRHNSTVTSIKNDISIPRYYLLRGDTPTYHIARALQDNGAVLRMKKQKCEILFLNGIKSQEATEELPLSAFRESQNDFLRHHMVPAIISCDGSGRIIRSGKEDSPVIFMPLHTSAQMQKATQALVHAGTINILLNMNIYAGDRVDIGKEKYIVMTAVHDVTKTSTKLWLSK